MFFQNKEIKNYNMSNKLILPPYPTNSTHTKKKKKINSHVLLFGLLQSQPNNKPSVQNENPANTQVFL